MTYPPEGVAAKIERAREHLDTLERESRTFVEGDEKTPWGFDINLNGAAGLWRAEWRGEHPPMPLRFSVIFGEFLFLLRSSMDHLARELVVVSGETPDEKETAFPVAETSTKFKSLGPQRMGGMNKAIRTCIRELQPYNAWPEHPTQTTIWRIHDYCNIDKHRLLHLSDIWLFTGYVRFVFEDGRKPVSIRAIREPKRMRLYHGAEMASYSWNPRSMRGRKVKMEFGFTFDVALAEGEFIDASGNPFQGMGTLQFMGNALEYMDTIFLPKFQPFFG